MLPCVADSTHLPLGESQVHVSPALGCESLVVLQTSAHDAAGDGEVAVVAARLQGNAPSVFGTEPGNRLVQI